MTDRYVDLLAGLPEGSAYGSQGVVLPYRGRTPHTFVFEGAVAGRAYHVYVSGADAGFTTADANGRAVVSVALPAGRGTVELEDTDTRARFVSYVHVKHIATLLAAQASVYETLDDAIEELRDAKSIRTASAGYLEAAHGRRVRQANDLGTWLHGSYGRLVRWLHQVYRNWAGRLVGLRQGVGAVAGSLPFRVPWTWRPRWTLGADLVRDAGGLDVRSRAVPVADLVFPQLNILCFAWVHATYGAPNAANAYPGPFTNPPTAQRIEVVFSAGWDGGAVTVTGTRTDGTAVTETFSPGAQPVAATLRVRGVVQFNTVTAAAKATVGTGGTASIGVEGRFATWVGASADSALGAFTLAYLTGPDRLRWGAGGLPVAIPSSGTYVLPAKNALRSGAELFGLAVQGGGYAVATERYLYLSVDGKGVVRTDLGGAGPHAAAAVAAAVNAAFNADPRYGAAFAAFASAVGAGPVGPVLRFASYELEGTGLQTGTAARVAVHAGAADAAGVVLGFPRRATTLTANAAVGAAHLAVTAASRLPWVDPRSTGVLWPATLDNVASWGAPVVQPETATRLAVVFAAGWAGGSLVVSGTTSAGVTTSETFTYTGAGAAQVVLGAVTFATLTGVANGVAGAGARAAWIGVRDQVSDASRGYALRVGRGLRLSSAAGTLTVEGGSGNTRALVTDAAYTQLASDVGGGVLVIGGGNAGLHDVIESTAAPAARIQHWNAGGGGTFANGAVTWRLYTTGELVRVVYVDTVANRVTLANPGLVTARTNLGGEPPVLVEDAAEMPVVDAGAATDPDYVTVTVDRTYLPPGIATDAGIDLVGTNVPDGWRTTNVTSAVLADGYVAATRLVLAATAAGDSMLWRSVAGLLTYRGFRVRVRAWVGQHAIASGTIRVEVDFGAAGVVVFGTAAVTGSYSSAAGSGPLDPVAVGGVAEVPVHATTAVVRVVFVATGAGQLWSVDTVLATIETDARGVYMGHGTVARSPNRQSFGELVWVWTPEAMTDGEKRGLGLVGVTGAAGTGDGHLETLMPAHAPVDRFDLTTYASGVPVNLVGVYDEVAWAACALTNLTIVLGTPAKATYVVPTRVTRAEQTLTFSAPSNATVSETSMHATDTQVPNAAGTLAAAGAFPQAGFAGPSGADPASHGELLSSDGVPVPAAGYAGMTTLPWRWTAQQTVQVASVAAGDGAPNGVWPSDGSALGGQAIFDTDAVWTLVYQRLTRVETSVFDLGASYADYLWLVDLVVHRRVVLTEVVDRAVQVAVTPDPDGRVTLPEPAADGAKATAVLVRDDGRTSAYVPATDFVFESASVLRVVPRALDTNALYALDYDVRRAVRSLACSAAGDVVLEHRSGTSQATAAAASWAVVQPDDRVRLDHRYHQLRLTLAGIGDVRDIEVQALGFRGVKLRAATPVAPGVVLP